MPRSGALPAYLEISEMLLREISAGRLLDGDRFAPEREMAQDFGVSVGTLRKALAELERQGYLDRRQGSGNYVRAGATPQGVYAFFRLEFANGGGFPTAEAVDVARLAKPETDLSFGKADDAHRIRRIRLLDGQPIALEEIWLDAARADDLTRADLLDSLYLYYKNTLGFWITRVEDRIGVAPRPDWSTETSLGDPCGYVERLSWAQDEFPVEYSRTWFNAGTARYVSRLR